MFYWYVLLKLCLFYICLYHHHYLLVSHSVSYPSEKGVLITAIQGNQNACKWCALFYPAPEACYAYIVFAVAYVGILCIRFSTARGSVGSYSNSNNALFLVVLVTHTHKKRQHTQTHTHICTLIRSHAQYWIVRPTIWKWATFLAVCFSLAAVGSSLCKFLQLDIGYWFDYRRLMQLIGCSILNVAVFLYTILYAPLLYITVRRFFECSWFCDPGRHTILLAYILTLSVVVQRWFDTSSPVWPGAARQLLAWANTIVIRTAHKHCWGIKPEVSSPYHRRYYGPVRCGYAYLGQDQNLHNLLPPCKWSLTIQP